MRRGRVPRGRLPPPLPSGEPLARAAATTSETGPSAPLFPLGERKPAPGERRHLSGPAAPSTVPQRSRLKRARGPRPVTAAVPQVTRGGKAGACRRPRAGKTFTAKVTSKASSFPSTSPKAARSKRLRLPAPLPGGEDPHIPSASGGREKLSPPRGAASAAGAAQGTRPPARHSWAASARPAAGYCCSR